MLKLSPSQLQEILDIIRHYHLTFIVNHVGESFLTKDDKKLLEKFGIDLSKIENIDTLGVSFKFGILSEALNQTQGNKITYEDFKKYLKSGRFIPLNKQENDILEAIKKQTVNDIKGLSDKIGNQIGDRILSEERKQRMIEAITEEEQRGIQERKSLRQVVSDIQDRTGDYSRDFDRIVEFRSNSAFQEGRVAAIKREDPEAKIYRQVYAQACKHCIKLYLTSGAGSEPILFTTEEIEANGDNIGRKSSEWLPVMGSTHPYCRCTWHRAIVGMKWNPETQLFDLYDEKYKMKVEGLPKPKVTITKDE